MLNCKARPIALLCSLSCEVFVSCMSCGTNLPQSPWSAYHGVGIGLYCVANVSFPFALISMAALPTEDVI